MRLFGKIYCLLSFCGFAATGVFAQIGSVSYEQRVDSLLHKMTLEEKVAQISHIHSWDIFDEKVLNESKLENLLAVSPRGFVEGFPLTAEQCREYMPRIQEYALKHTRLSVPVFTVAESLHGSVHEGSTIFPQNIALASTFNPTLAYRRAEAISGELHYQGIRQILAPCVDVVRDLRWGRVEECYGEDPFLNGIFAYEEVKGYLDSGISPMLKHFGAHGNPMGGLNLASVNCGVGELHDVYLYPFKRVITSLPVQAVMSTYNSWNRVSNSASHYLLTDVLRNQWGFKGYVITDSVKSAQYFLPSECLVAGNDRMLGGSNNVSVWGYTEDEVADDMVIQAGVRESYHRYLYTYVNSSVMNGISEKTDATGAIAWWILTLQLAMGICFVLFVVFLVLFILKYRKERKNNESEKIQ